MILTAVVVWAEEPALPAITSVTLGAHREFLVNGKPFLPIMGWLQGAGNLSKLTAIGCNTIAGFWWGDTKDGEKAVQYDAAARKAGLYFIPNYQAACPEAMKTLAASGNVLAWIHGDEPDNLHDVSEAEVVPGPGLHLNAGAPLWRMLTGDQWNWSVVDPLAGAQFILKFKHPLTVTSLAVWLTLSKGLSTAKEMTFSDGEKELLKVTLENKSGQQKFELPAPATFSALTVKVTAVNPGDNVWGSFAQLEGFDKDGKVRLPCPAAQRTE